MELVTHSETAECRQTDRQLFQDRDIHSMFYKWEED